MRATELLWRRQGTVLTPSVPKTSEGAGTETDKQNGKPGKAMQVDYNCLEAV